MPLWFWIALWVLLVLGALSYLAWLALRLFRKANAALEAAQPILDQLTDFAKATSERPHYSANPDNLLDDPVPLIQARTQYSKARTAKAAERQRRLINKLFDFDFNESEFKNEP